jgi:type IV pilus assembly protein PilE
MSKRRQQGFTLIELMMVIGIVAIIAILAVSSYGDNVIAAKRSDGRRALQDTAARLEKCKSMYGSYNSNNCSVKFPVASPEGLYSITARVNNTSFQLTATPAAGSSQNNDTDCTSMTLNHLGQKGGTGAAPNVCW